MLLLLLRNQTMRSFMFENELSHEKVKQIHQPREKAKRSQAQPQAKGLSTTLSEYVPSERTLNVMILFPNNADLLSELHAP